MLWGRICSCGGSCLLNANNVLRNGTRTFLASATVRQPFEKEWKGMVSPWLLQITQRIPYERKTMAALPTSCLIKQRQIHQCCSALAAWLPFSHHLFTEASHLSVEAIAGKSVKSKAGFGIFRACALLFLHRGMWVSHWPLGSRT